MESKDNLAAKVKLGWGKTFFILFAFLAAGYYGNLFMPRVPLAYCSKYNGCQYLFPVEIFSRIKQQKSGRPNTVNLYSPPLFTTMFLNQEPLYKKIQRVNKCHLLYEEAKARYQLNDGKLEKRIKYDGQCPVFITKTGDFIASPYLEHVDSSFSEGYSFVRYFAEHPTHSWVLVRYFGFFNRFSSYAALFVVALGGMAFSRYILTKTGLNTAQQAQRWRWIIPLSLFAVASIYILDALLYSAMPLGILWAVAWGGILAAYLFLSCRCTDMRWWQIALEFLLLQIVLIGLIKGNHYTYCAPYEHEPALFQNLTHECMEKIIGRE